MKIGIAGSRGYPYVYSGYETFVKELAEGLQRRGHEVIVYAHRELFAERPAVVNGIRVVYVPGVRSKTLSQLTHSGLSTVAALVARPDVLLFVNSANGPFGALTRLFRVRSAINVDGMEWLRPKWQGLGRVYFRWASRQATRWFDAVVSDSVRMSEIYEREFGVRAETIAYGAHPPAAADPALLAQRGLQPGDYYLVVGRLIPDNNLDTILSGFVKSRSPRKLAVVGDVPYDDPYASREKAKVEAVDPDAPMTEQPWFWPTVLGGGAGALVLLAGGTYVTLVGADVLPDPRPASGAAIRVALPQ